jgi:hemolysin activation/secretion protein
MSVSQLRYANINQFAYPRNTGGAKGEATTVGLSLTYALNRSAASNSNISLGFDRKRYANQQQFDSTYTSQYQIRNFVLGYTGNRYDGFWGGGVTQGGVSLTRGYVEFGDQNPRNTSGELIYGKFTPADFAKINFNLSRNQQIVPDKTILNIALSGQLANSDLDPAERFYLGGPNGVRGYPGSQGSGSQGALVNLELQQSLENRLVGLLFVDVGVVQQYKDKDVYNTNKQRTGADNVYTLSSFGLGLKQQNKDLVWSTSVAWRLGNNPLLDSQGNRVNNDSRYKKPYVWAQVQWMF